MGVHYRDRLRLFEKRHSLYQLKEETQDIERELSFLFEFNVT